MIPPCAPMPLDVADLLGRAADRAFDGRFAFVAGVGAVERAQDLASAGAGRFDEDVARSLDLVDRHDVGRVGHGDDELVLLELDRDQDVATCHVFRHAANRTRIEFDLLQVIMFDAGL